MQRRQFSIEDLRRILREGAGADDLGALGDDTLDTEFEDLGYDSLALLETGGRIDREFGVTLPDSVLVDARTPRALIETVNSVLAGASA